LLLAGCTVFAIARRMDRLALLASRDARTLPLDLTDDSSMRTAVYAILAKVGRIPATAFAREVALPTQNKKTSSDPFRDRISHCWLNSNSNQ
jgi:hypothetical protein